MKFFDLILENSSLIKNLISAIESTTQLLKDISKLCVSLSGKINEQQLVIDQIYDLLEHIYNQEIDDIGDLKGLASLKKDSLN